MEAVQDTFGKGDYVVNRQRRILKIMNTPKWCALDDTREPAYLLWLVGSTPDHVFKMEKNKMEAEHKRYHQKAEECTKVKPPMFAVDAWLLHVSTGGVYQITHLPTTCVLEHNRKPCYGYRMKDGRICFRSQDEVEDGRFGRVDALFAALMLSDETVSA